MFDRFFCFCCALVFSHTLLLGQDIVPNRGRLFDNDVVPRVDILIPVDTLAWILHPNNAFSDQHWRATFVFDDGQQKDTVEEVGFRIRGNTSRVSQKKSFKISFNTFEQGRKFEGVEKLNLNGEHNDPTVARARICWDALRDLDMPGSRANHVALYINQAYFGIYANIEHIDDEFVQSRFGATVGNLYKCTWPADLNYLGANPNAYKVENGGRRTYELQTNTNLDDYSDIARFIQVLTQTSLSELPCELEAIFDIRGYLKAQAFDIITGNWDGYAYNKNNFYLYQNPQSGLMQYIHFDLDNTVGIDWLQRDWAVRNIYNWSQGGQSRPLYERLLQIPKYKDLLSFYIREMRETVFNDAQIDSKIIDIKTQIRPFVIDDPYYPDDYGFDIQDFDDGFVMGLPYSQTPYGIVDYLKKRRENIDLQLLPLQSAVVLGHKAPKRIFLGQQVAVQLKLGTGNFSSTQDVCWTFGNETVCTNLYDDGLNNDGLPNDGWYGATCPLNLSGVGVLSYYFRISAQSVNQQWPSCGVFETEILGANSGFVINEFMAKNAATIQDEAGQYEDWIELFNHTDIALDTKDFYLSDNPDNLAKWALPEMTIPAQGYLLIWADEEGSQGSLHANFKLSGSGETIILSKMDAAGNINLEDEVVFGAQNTDISEGRLPNGSGPFTITRPTPNANNEPLSVKYQPDAVSRIAVYPNPASNKIFISAKEVLTKVQLSILKLDGSIISLRPLDNGQEWNLSLVNLPSGVYYLRISAKEGTFFNRIVVL